MHIEYLEAGSNDCPLIRLYPATPATVGLLICAISQLLTNRSGTIELGASLNPINLNEFTLSLTETDEGITKCKDPGSFCWCLEQDSWENVLGLLSPFLVREGRAMHQWLTGPESLVDVGDINLIITTSDYGQW
jgi:hypothetical protein